MARGIAQKPVRSGCDRFTMQTRLEDFQQWLLFHKNFATEKVPFKTHCFANGVFVSQKGLLVFLFFLQGFDIVKVRQ